VIDGMCTATVLVLDDRWGSYRDECKLQTGHAGPHVSPRTACEPTAWLSWMGGAQT
jgi:hypothetical protein